MQKEFIDKHNLGVILGSDLTGKVCEDYGVWIEKSMYGRKYMGIDRSTFLVGKNGIIYSALMHIGIIDSPLQLLYTDMAVYLGIVYTYIPFMILPLYANLEKMDTSLHDAAADLGARPWQVFINITLPLSIPGILAGSLLVFIPAIGEYVIPALLGGLDSLMIGRTLYDEFFVNRDWPLASAVATILLLILVIPIMLFQRSQRDKPQS